MDWNVLSVQGKRSALVKVGYARDYRTACRVLGKHSAAVKAGRARRDDRKSRARNAWWNK